MVEMNFQFWKAEKIENEVGVMSMEGNALALSCVSPKKVEMSFQFWKEEKFRNELSVVSTDGAALAQSSSWFFHTIIFTFAMSRYTYLFSIF